MKPFVGRKQELQRLHDLSRQGRAVLVVIKGRRRVGKSRLAEEFSEGKIYLPFSGLAPVEGISAQQQRDAFARQLSQHFGLPPFRFDDWSDGFSHLSQHLNDNPTVILFDEISWMGAKDATFIPKLKVWWDIVLQKYANVMMILCGSISTWIEENIINSTAFFGRISLHLDLVELSLPEAYQFLKIRGFKGSVYDTFKVLAVTGGVPWYLEQIDAQLTADENLKRLCFETNGLMVQEFDRIFHDLFSGQGEIYKKIIQILAQGMRNLGQIREMLAYPHSGSLSNHLKMLVISGFVTQHYTWSLKTGASGKRSLYRLSDNYLRFYIKYIQPNLRKIQENSYQELSLDLLPGWEAMIGFQVESLILKNRHLFLKMLGIPSSDIVADNPYIQRTTARQKGCQIDYLIQTHSNNLYVCEFKFRRREIGSEVIEQVQEKIERFSVPRGFGVAPVLLHLAGVSEKVHEKRYFYRIIDIADFLQM